MSKPASKQQPCYCILLRNAARIVTGIYDDALAPSGLRVTQFATLNTLRRLGPSSLQDLAAAMRLDRTTLVRNLELLKKRGLVEEVAPAGKPSRKPRLVRLTAAGEAGRQAAEPLRDQARDRVYAALSQTERDSLNAILDKIQALAE